MKKIIKVAAIVIGISGITTGLLALSKRNAVFVKAKTPVKTVTRVIKFKPIAITYDTALLNKFNKVCRLFDLKDAPVTYSGTINMRDGADTVTNISNLHYLYIQNGNASYYRAGKMEMMNNDDVYLYVEHDAKRMILAGGKKAPEVPVVSGLTMAEKLQSEQFTMSDSRDEKYESISFTNEHHISCKQYTLTFDPVNLKVKNVYIRLTCFNDPLNKKKDKVINMSLDYFEHQADLRLYGADRILTKNANGWALKQKYTDYKLIKVP